MGLSCPIGRRKPYWLIPIVPYSTHMPVNGKQCIPSRLHNCQLKKSHTQCSRGLSTLDRCNAQQRADIAGLQAEMRTLNKDPSVRHTSWFARD